VRISADEVICGFGRTGEWFAARHGHEAHLDLDGEGDHLGLFPMGAITIEEVPLRTLIEHAWISSSSMW